jgi:hypothetical protein
MLPSDARVADARKVVADFNPWQTPMDPGMHAWEAAILAESQHHAARVLDQALRRVQPGHEAFLRSHGELPWHPGSSK